MTPEPTKLGEMIRLGRKKLRLNQAELGQQLGHSRQWVAQIERGQRYGDDIEAVPHPDMLMKIATILDLSIVDLLIAADIPKSEWPNLSHMRSKDVNVRTIDLSPLTTRQMNLIEELVTELKTGNHDTRTPNGNDR